MDVTCKSSERGGPSFDSAREAGWDSERREWNTCNEPPERRLWHWLSECAGDKCQSKCKEEALRCLSSLNIQSFLLRGPQNKRKRFSVAQIPRIHSSWLNPLRSCCRNKGGWKSSASRQANDGFEPLTAKASRSKPGALFDSKPVVPNLRGTRFSLPFSRRLGWLFNTLHRKKKEVFYSQEGRLFYTMDECADRRAMSLRPPH